jgi:hypothetical protein
LQRLPDQPRTSNHAELVGLILASAAFQRC